MSAILDALLPVLLIIAAGHVVARLGIITGEQWRGVERIAYFLLFPAMIISTVAQTDFKTLPTVHMSVVLVLSILVMAGVLLALRPVLHSVLGIEGARFTSVFQGAVRWNSFVALAIAGKLLGPDGISLIAVAFVVVNPLVNLACVFALSRFVGGQAPSAGKLLLDLIGNPFIWSTLVGLGLNVTGSTLPEVVSSTLEMLGAAALPVGIVCFGARLEPRTLRRPGPALMIATTLRLLVMPAFGFSFAMITGLVHEALLAVMIALSVPAGGGAYLLARQRGGDAVLMAEILTLQTLAAAATMPVIFLLVA
ncbi:MAG: AEC family transporter [Hyphomicrobiales bacterium]